MNTHSNPERQSKNRHLPKTVTSFVAGLAMVASGAQAAQASEKDHQVSAKPLPMNVVKARAEHRLFEGLPLHYLKGKVTLDVPVAGKSHATGPSNGGAAPTAHAGPTIEQVTIDDPIVASDMPGRAPKFSLANLYKPGKFAYGELDHNKRAGAVSLHFYQTLPDGIDIVPDAAMARPTVGNFIFPQTATDNLLLDHPMTPEGAPIVDANDTPLQIGHREH